MDKQNVTADVVPQSVSEGSVKRKRRLALLALLVVAVLLGGALAYALMWQSQEKSDTAYVDGHSVQVASPVGGTVRKVMVEDSDIVKKGDVLVVLDDSDFQLAYERAQSELIQAIRAARRQGADTAEARANVLVRKAELARAQSDLRRRESLAGTDAVSGEELSHARAAVVQAQATLKAAEAQALSAQMAGVENIPLRQQPAVVAAVSRVKEAWLNLQRTQIRAPIAGQISGRSSQIGQQTAQGAALMAVVPLQDVWVTAEFDEQQLRHMRIGQPVRMEARVYGKQVGYRGQVMGVSSRATGQRIPVRISFDAEQLRQYPLRVGASMSVNVDTRQTDGKSMAVTALKNPTIPEAAPVDWTAAEALIEQIFEKYAK